MSSAIILPPERHIQANPRARKGRKRARLAFYRSLDGADGNEGWEYVLPGNVPKWLTTSAVIRELLAGEMAQDESVDPYWYRAERMEEH